MFEGKKKVKDEVIEGKMEVVKEPKKFDNTALSIVKIGNEWALVKVSYSLDHNECITEVLRTEVHRDIVFEQFKMDVAREFLLN